MQNLREGESQAEFVEERGSLLAKLKLVPRQSVSKRAKLPRKKRSKKIKVEDRPSGTSAMHSADFMRPNALYDTSRRGRLDKIRKVTSQKSIETKMHTFQTAQRALCVWVCVGVCGGKSTVTFSMYDSVRSVILPACVPTFPLLLRCFFTFHSGIRTSSDLAEAATLNHLRLHHCRHRYRLTPPQGST